MKEFDYVYEMCPYCEQEVKLKAELSIQICPNCGKEIKTCAMCLGCPETCPLEGDN